MNCIQPAAAGAGSIIDLWTYQIVPIQFQESKQTVIDRGLI